MEVIVMKRLYGLLMFLMFGKKPDLAKKKLVEEDLF